MNTPGIRRTTEGWKVSATYQGDREQRTVQTKREATAMRKHLLAKLKARAKDPEINLADSDLTLGEAYKRSMRNRWANAKSKNTMQSYLDQCLDFIGWTTRLVDIDVDMMVDLQEHFQKQGNANATVNKKLNCIRSIFIDANKDKLINMECPWPKLLPEKNLKDEVFSRAEEEAFAEWYRQAGHPEMADMFLFAIDTCARAGELRKLRICDFTFYKKDGKELASVTFEDRKAGNTGSVPLTPRARAIAKKYSHKKGKLWSYEKWEVCDLFNEAKMGVGLEHRTRLTWHCTRHTCATRLAQANMSLAMIMNFGGWTSLRSVRRYLHVQVGALNPCVEALESY